MIDIEILIPLPEKVAEEAGPILTKPTVNKSAFGISVFQHALSELSAQLLHCDASLTDEMPDDSRVRVGVDWLRCKPRIRSAHNGKLRSEFRRTQDRNRVVNSENKSKWEGEYEKEREGDCGTNSNQVVAS